jgi:hypothetical protein
LESGYMVEIATEAAMANRYGGAVWCSLDIICSVLLLAVCARPVRTYLRSALINAQSLSWLSL